MGLCLVFTSFQDKDRPFNSHINGKGSSRALVFSKQEFFLFVSKPHQACQR